jgi:uncharacterized protein (DUF885 family)
MLVLTIMLTTVTVPQLTQEYLAEYYRYSPTAATAVGYHRDGVDRRLDDISPAARSRRMAYLKGLRQKLAALGHDSLSPDDRADARLLEENIALELVTLEEAKDYSRRVDSYVGGLGNTFFNMTAREYAPADARAADIAARLGQVPRYLAQAKKNIAVSIDAFHDAALDDGRGSYDFLKNDLPKAFEGKPGMAQIEQALPAALAAIDGYLKWVDGPYRKLPKASWRYGRALYDKRFPHYLQTDLSPDEVLARAEAQIKSVRAEMARLARGLWAKAHPGKDAPADEGALVKAVLDEIAKDHSTPEGMFSDAKADVAREQKFVADHHLLTLPPTDNLRVMETPPFMRSLYGVAGFDGAPPLQPELGAFYYVTPFPKDWSKERVESKLREYNRWNMEIISIHEAMPGHFVQFQFANRVQPDYRRVARWMLSSNAYAEGWGVFAQELMVEAGYLGGDPRFKLAEMKNILRVLANSVLDIRLHSRELSEDDAIKLMIDTTFQERTEAEQKMRRARLDVTQLCTYFVGLEEWRSIRDAARKAQGKAFDQRAFLDRALSYGPVAMPSLRELMLSGGGTNRRAPAAP